MTPEERAQKRRDALAKGRATAASNREKARLAKMLGADGVTDAEVQDIGQMTTRDAEGRVQKAINTAGTAVQDGVVTHRGPRSVIMYDANGVASRVTTNNIYQSHVGGLRLECPHCGGEHDDPDDPNGCPVLPPKKYAVCPVCPPKLRADGTYRRKRIYDELRGDEHILAETQDDPNAVAVSFNSTAETRVNARLKQHIIAFHERTAQEMGLVTPMPVGAVR